MRTRTPYTSLARSPRLHRRSGDDPESYWTQALGAPPSVYGERIVEAAMGTLRRWDPNRSKLGAAITKGWTEPLPQPGERWLYLGAASGTTASHLADLLGPDGALYAVEKSIRPFGRLLELAGRYPNLAPLLSDARHWEEFVGIVPPVEGLYVDIAQPDQVGIALDCARRFLKGSGALLLALKTSSMGREAGPRGHLDRSLEAIEDGFVVEATLALDPFHRKHYLIGARATRRLVRPAERAGGARLTRPATHAARPR
ncbi:MAG: fibrillarin-like rRNA/tRNA 2'-O-methyltransferase [Thermoplasmata archaeon]|nr:fibrillarin-like rRNA/tRNA 2'-O-methyltransferase [Thermoplasmata archaeon]MCI4359440.1 fibrillarin-like rRNA/tRNA 2'-O-methyltransferase [Thermoplasmata archaeon]